MNLHTTTAMKNLSSGNGLDFACDLSSSGGNGLDVACNLSSSVDDGSDFSCNLSSSGGDGSDFSCWSSWYVFSSDFRVLFSITLLVLSTTKQMQRRVVQCNLY